MSARSTRGRAAAQRVGALCALCALCACTDPRARPVPPQVSLFFSPAIEVVSPGTFGGSLYAFDSDGLSDLRIRLTSEDGAVAVDSFVALDPVLEQTRMLNFELPAGLTVGTRLTLVTTVSDFAGFQTTDSTFFTTQPTP